MLSTKISRISLLIACVTVCATAKGAEPTSQSKREQAKEQYAVGVSAYQEGHYHEAIERFLSADRLEPSPALSFNIARAYEKLADPARALEYYRDYVRRGAAPSQEQQVRARIRELEAALRSRNVQQVTVLTVPPGAEVHIDARPPGLTPYTVELTPGSHELVLRKDGFAEARRAFVLEPERALDVSVELRSPPPQHAPSALQAPGRTAHTAGAVAIDRLEGDSPLRRTLPWVTLGLGGAALASAGVFEALRRSAEEDANTGPQIEAEEQRERAESRKTAARVLTGVGAALAVGGGVWAYLDVQKRKSGRTSAALGCTPWSCVGTLRVRF